MNFLNVFEDRVSGIFGTTAAPMPFSFKKMAKRAAHEMENETYVINGVETAPALYTILISQEDDALMRPIYEELTQETAQFLEAQAERKGYSFIGQPLVRFMVDPSLKSGRFSAFAENIDGRTLERLRDEEQRFMQSRAQGGLGGAAQPTPQVAPTQRAPQGAPAPRAHRDQTSTQGDPRQAPPAWPQEAPQDAYDDYDHGYDGLDVFPDDYETAEEPLEELEAAPMPEPAPEPAPAPAPTPKRERRSAPAPQKYEDRPTQAMLIDRQSGRTYVIKGTRAIIGRERTPGGLILRDPNVSRRHAELDFDGSHWIVTDLNSTNGTLVNDVDVDECTLHDGDVVTLGLTNLEFRES